MPRIPRMSLPVVALHIVRRGNNRQAVLFEPPDHRAYLDSCRGKRIRRKKGVGSHYSGNLIRPFLSCDLQSVCRQFCYVLDSGVPRPSWLCQSADLKETYVMRLSTFASSALFFAASVAGGPAIAQDDSLSDCIDLHNRVAEEFDRLSDGVESASCDFTSDGIFVTVQFETSCIVQGSLLWEFSAVKGEKGETLCTSYTTHVPNDPCAFYVGFPVPREQYEIKGRDAGLWRKLVVQDCQDLAP